MAAHYRADSITFIHFYYSVVTWVSQVLPIPPLDTYTHKINKQDDDGERRRSKLVRLYCVVLLRRHALTIYGRDRMPFHGAAGCSLNGQ